MKRLGIILLLILITGCIQAPQNNRAVLLNNVVSNPKAPANVPVFTQGLNFFQNSGQIFTTNMSLSLDFKDVIYLRGQDIDTYIRNNGTQTTACVVTNFLSNAQTLIASAIPQSIYNFTNQSIEYYYTISFADNLNNQNFCNKPGITNALTGALIYEIKSLCNNGLCNSNYSSQGFDLYSVNGSKISQVNLKNLSLGLTAAVTSTGTGTSCVTNTQCTSQGFDCCSNGQCVKDLALQSGVDQTKADYKQALQDILNNPSHVYLYPNFYYICSMPVGTPTAPSTGATPPMTPVNAAIARLRNLENLYNCTTKTYGELGICAVTYPNATTNTPYYAGADDLNFSGTYDNISPLKESLVSITEVIYGDVPLFNFASKSETELSNFIYTDLTATPYVSIAGLHNNDVTSGAQVTLLNLPSNALSKDLVIKYLVDASCVEINPSLAKCDKYYTQGQKNYGTTTLENRLGRVMDHYPSTNIFKLPYYASTTQAFTVTLNGVALQKDTDWQLLIGSPNAIQLIAPIGLNKAADTQQVKISFFVNQSMYKIMESKKLALNQIKAICSCADTRCTLTPIKNTLGNITDYSCVYPNPDPVVAPYSQLVYLSSKSVPVRYFDNKGVSQSVITGSTLPQEGNTFSYINNDLLVPSNMPSTTITDPYVGFNEIYGSLSYGPTSAKPAKEVNVNIGSSYDIYVDRGAFSTCTLCGNDYYSQLNKVFPLAQLGQGLVPNRTQSNGAAQGVRADDFLFGRACFIPATMIPWTHAIASVVNDQRMNRMRSQHFMYANGYQRDWFGFNYGSVIGSFDGVKWFSIGVGRRVKASTNKLFLAVNGAMGDLTLEDTYNVTINDATLNPAGTNIAATDLDSEGASCQKFHICKTDSDCAASLGWDYACTSVNDETTSWPVFDANGYEVPDAQVGDNRLTSILGISGNAKRCVYRGRGTACTANSNNTALSGMSSLLFNTSTSESFHSCSTNNFCQTIATPNAFNNRINRFGKVKTDTTTDTIGNGTPEPLRPLNYIGQETIRAEAVKNLNINKVGGLCVPGRDPETTLSAQNSTSPRTKINYDGDKILGIGLTRSGVTANANYLSSCSILDDTKNYYHTQIANIIGGTITGTLQNSAGTQAISTNALTVFDSALNLKGYSKILKTSTELIRSAGYQQNRCMRAPGATCFQDLECAPSKTIADKVKLLTAADVSSIASAELKFWQEDLVCSQATDKADPTFDPINNRCCREVGKTISIDSRADLLKQTSIAGIDIDINDPKRYSRVSTIYKDMKTDTTIPPLASYPFNGCPGAAAVCKDIYSTSTNPLTPPLFKYQYKTFAMIAERTSCSGHWVRNFNTGVNNHQWSAAALQNIDPSSFKCLNWLPNKNDSNHQYNTCSGVAQGTQAQCLCVQTMPTSSKAKGVLSFLGKLELTGIPQIVVPTESLYTGITEGDLSCKSDPNPTDPAVNFLLYPHPRSYPPSSPAVQPGNYKVMPNVFATSPAPVADYIDSSFTPTQTLYATTDLTNFDSKIKQIFKSDEVVACLPAGTEIAITADASLCCTGFIDQTLTPSGKGRCALRDFVDVSVYTNRYVSSEATKLNQSAFDPDTGYIKDPSQVASLACNQRMCASGTLLSGVLISNMVITGWENFATANDKIYRFLEGQVSSDDYEKHLTLYKQGLKLNDHIYCYPKNGLNSASMAGLNPISCGY